MSDLTGLETAVLSILSENATGTVSAVSVASDLADRRPETERGDPVGLVTFVLGALNDRGLVVYRLQSVPHQWRDAEGNTSYGLDLPTNIRLTADGWDAAGYPNRIGVVGTGSRHYSPPRHPGDRTDYRTHHGSGSSPPSGPIERMPLPEHMNTYPGHLFHLYGGPFVSDTPSTIRHYTSVTPDLEAAAILYKSEHPTAGYAEIAEVLDLSERTVKYILVDRPRLRGLATKSGDEATDNESTRARMLRVINDFGPFRDVFDLRTVLATAEDPHNLTHILESLHRQGLITFKTRREGNVTTYRNIRARTRQERTAVPVEAEPAEPVADVLPVTSMSADDASALAPDEAEIAEVIESPAPEPEATSDTEGPEASETVSPPITLSDTNGHWPVLSLVIRNERDRIDAEDRAAIYLRAAESLANLDPEEAERLTTKAASVAPPAPSDIEAEYLAFATAVVREHGGLPKE